MWVCHKPDKLNVKETQVEANAAEEDKDNGKDIDEEQEAMTMLADDRNDEWQYIESSTGYIIAFLCSALVIYIIGVIMLITSNLLFGFLLDLTSMKKTYQHNVPTITAPLLSPNFLTPKVITSGTIAHSGYIITYLARASRNFDTALIQAYIQSLAHPSNMQYIYYLYI